MNKPIHWRVPFGLLLVASALSQPPAHAQSASAQVQLGDVDVSTRAGMEIARARLRDTARRLCDKVIDPWSVSRQPAYVRCVDDAVADAGRRLQKLALLAKR